MSTVEKNTIIVVNLNQRPETKTLIAELHKRHFIAHETFGIDTALHACQRCESAHILIVCDAFDQDTLARALQNTQPKHLKSLIVYAQASAATDAVSMEDIPLCFVKQDEGHAALLTYLSQYALSQSDVVLGAIKEGIISLDEQQCVQYLNPAALQLLGLTKQDVCGRSIDQVMALHDLISNEHLAFSDIKHQLDPSNEVAYPVSEKNLYVSFKNLNGRQYKLAVRLSTLHSRQSSFAYVLVLRDITEKYTPLPKIQAAENKYWALVNTTQLGYTILDKQGRVIDANDEFIRITGHHKLEDILGIDARAWISDFGRTNLFQAIDELVKTGRVVGIEIDFKGTNGLITPIEFNATIIKEDGEYYVLGIGRDISERRRTEKEKEMIQTQLRQAQKMEAIGQLTGGIAHDFNNVLASILGYTELSQQLFIAAHNNPYQNPLQASDKLEAYLNAIHEAGTRARDLVKQLMVFSRGSDIAPQYMRIEPAVHEIMKLLSSTLPKTINVTTHFDSNLPLIHIDPIQLHQVIMNLCINSRDALNEVGDITISVSRDNKHANKICASCHGKTADNYIAITVHDNGPGIAEQHRDRIFEPFYTTKTIGQGTGMGLSMVHGIMHEHAGHIVLETHPQRGTAFHLLFPVTEETVPTTTRPASLHFPLSAPPKPKGFHIVIIEDEESLASFLSDLFSNHGYKVTTFTNSRIAQKNLPKLLNEIDLILTDHTMPGITGLQIAKEVLALKPELPIILCTGFSFKIDEKTAYTIGISRFLQKPISTTDLLKAVETLLKSRTLSLS